MRIVVFSGLFPPLTHGGDDIDAAAVVEELRHRGHEVLVLSSRSCFVQDGNSFRHEQCPSRDAILDTGLCVFGSLPHLLRRHPLSLLRRAVSCVLARRRYCKTIAKFRPERVLLFHPAGVVAPVLHDLAQLAREAGAEVHANVSDNWLAQWPAANPLRRGLERWCRSPSRAVRLFGMAVTAALRWLAWAPEGTPPIDRVFWSSAFVRKASFSGGEVLSWGVANLSSLPQPTADHFHGDAPLTLLFAGRVEERQGLNVLLRAMADCQEAHHLVVLDAEGSTHAAECKRLATALKLTQHVHFLGRQPHGEMMARLGRLGHILVVPSLDGEPACRLLADGMALGLPVVVSAGGADEFVRDGVTGFVFPPGDAAALTAILDRLERDRNLCARVGESARQTAVKRFSIERLVDRLLGESRAPLPLAA